MIKALFGLESLQFSRNKETSFSWRDNLEKGESPIPVNCFIGFSHEEISAVILSDKRVFEYPDATGTDLFIVNNPNAKYPLDISSALPFLKRWQAEKNNNGITLTKLY